MNQERPIYHIRISKRAKYARLVMQGDGMLEMVLPMGMNHDDAEYLVRSHKDWIAKHQPTVTLPIVARPSHVIFPSLNQTIMIEYSNSDKESYQEQHGKLTIYSNNDAFIPSILRHWLKQKGKIYLPSMLLSIAEEMNETYQSVSVRLQKTRWGSCSNQRRINLNAKLLLLPKDLLRYVLIHELSHLQHLNHSPKFWQRVAQFNPDYAEKRQALHAWEKQGACWLH